MKIFITYHLIILSFYSINIHCLADCPTNCSCSPDESVLDTLFSTNSSGFKVSPVQVLCHQAGITVLPVNFPNHTTTLDLSENNLTQIGPVNNLPDLKRWNLSFDRINQIQAQAFDSLVNLEILDLQFNLIKFLPDMLFQKLEQIKILNLGYNQIEALRENTFDGQIWLEELVLAGNPIKALPEDLFKQTARLRKLDLSRTNLWSLPDLLFHYTPALEALDLSRCQFISVPKEELQAANHLKELDISENPMKMLNVESFHGLFQLETIKINDMPALRKIDEYTFSDLCKLKYLEITHNKYLSEIHYNAFVGLTYNTSCFALEQVYLQSNQLSRLSKNTLPVCHIPKVDLRDNQWRCDCNLKWLKSCKQDDPLHRQITCLEPLELDGVEIADISEEKFQCPSAQGSFDLQMRLFRLFVITFGVLMLVFMGLVIIFYLHKVKILGKFGNRYQRMGSIHYVKAPNEVQE